MINMWIIYAACVVGAVGVLLMAPRGGRRLAAIGSLVGAGALGAAFIAILNAAGADEPSRPGFLFYLFAFIAAAAAVRMITHPRPVFAALYFILVVVATSGLFLLLEAEFIAFALVIVYAGAIIVTYLFVIMLAQEAPSASEVGALAPYDATAREPVAAVVIGFILLAALLTVMYRGTSVETMPTALHEDPATIAHVPAKVKRTLVDADLMDEDAIIVDIDPDERVARVQPAGGGPDEPEIVPLPESLIVENVERVGLSLLTEFPVSLEVAGVILMMAMLGAVILARQPGMTGPGSGGLPEGEGA